MQRLSDDRGAVSVVVALLMVPLLAVAAVAIDVAAMYADRQQLQTGADAAALSIAQMCARDTCTPADAEHLVELNKNDGDATGTVLALDETTGQVTAQASSTREHWFAPVVGIDSTDIAAQSTARWGYPTGGPAVLPIAFSWCEVSQQAGITPITNATGRTVGLDITGTTAETVMLPTKSSQSECFGPSDLALPGGFGWVPVTDQAECLATTRNGDTLPSDPGKDFPCKTSSFSGEKLKSRLGTTVLLPIFDAVTGGGSTGAYTIVGYAAFILTDYYFGSYDAPGTGACGTRTGNDHCLAGRFTTFVDLTTSFDFSPSGMQIGAAAVRLTQ